jgi:phosphoesterase RecJ-like protein
MACDWQPLVDLVRQGRRFLLTTHVRPDGDGLGSMKALAHGLRQQGKEVSLVIPTSMIPPRYDFLDAEKEFTPFTASVEAQRSADTLLVLDTGTWNQLSDMAEFVKKSPARKGVIDHHLTQDDLGAVRFVDTTAEATGRLVHEALLALGTPLTPESANALFVAVAMDTGWFRHGNTTPRTFALAAELVAAGANPPLLYEKLFERSSLGRLKLTGLVLGRLTLLEQGRVACSRIVKADYAATGAMPPDSEDLVNWTLGVMGVEVGLLFMEQPVGGIKISFRSRSQVDVAKLAQQFGGGGHAAAAGAIQQGTIDEVQARVLAALGKVMGTSPA